MELAYIGTAVFFGVLLGMLLGNIFVMYARLTHNDKLALKVARVAQPYARFFRLDSQQDRSRRRRAA